MKERYRESAPTLGWACPGFEIHVNPALAGAKKAVLVGERKLVVSPAMYDLMSNATPEELRKLCEAIHTVRVPDFFEPTKFRMEPRGYEDTISLNPSFFRYG